MLPEKGGAEKPLFEFIATRTDVTAGSIRARHTTHHSSPPPLHHSARPGFEDSDSTELAEVPPDVAARLAQRSRSEFQTTGRSRENESKRFSMLTALPARSR